MADHAHKTRDHIAPHSTTSGVSLETGGFHKPEVKPSTVPVATKGYMTGHPEPAHPTPTSTAAAAHATDAHKAAHAPSSSGPAHPTPAPTAPAAHAHASSSGGVPRYMQSHDALHKDHATAPHASTAPATHSAVSVEHGPFHKPAPAPVTRQDIPTKSYMH